MKKTLRLLACAIVSLMSASAFAQADAEVTTVLEADFTQFTEGSPESPVSFPSYGTGSFSSYFPGWSAYKAFQAGGALLIQDGGYAQSPATNLSANDGTSKVTVRFRAMDDYGCGIKVSIGYAATASTTQYYFDNEWHTESYILQGGSSYSRVDISPQLAASGILIEYVKVEQSPAFYAAPVAYQPNSADGTSFVASWSNVSGATNYYLDVYSFNEAGEKVYALENEDCGLSRTKTVSGLDASKTYYYVVRASNGTATSEDSNEIEVVRVLSSIDTPVVNDVTVSNGKATISWNPVENAQSYILNFYRHTTLTESKTVDILHEDFSKVNEGTLSSIEYTFPRYLNNYTSTPGWSGSELGLAVGCMVLSPYTGGNATLVTPALDLSGDNGAFSVSVTVADAAYGTFYEGGQFSIKVLDADDNELASKDFELAKDFQTYEADFTVGTTATRVEIYYAENHKLFIDEITVKQNRPAGAVIDELIAEESVKETTYTFDFEPEENVQIGFTVIAVGRTVTNGNITAISSAPSEEKIIDTTSAIDNVTVSEAAVEISVVAPGTITVNAPEAVKVIVTDLTGRVIASTTVNGNGTIETGYHGFAIVKAGNTVAKLKL